MRPARAILVGASRQVGASRLVVVRTAKQAAEPVQRGRASKRVEGGSVGQSTVTRQSRQSEQGPGSEQVDASGTGLYWLMVDMPAVVRWWWQDWGWLGGPLLQLLLLLLLLASSHTLSQHLHALSLQRGGGM